MSFALFVKELKNKYTNLEPAAAGIAALCVLGILYICPFIYYRLQHEQWIHAAVNIVILAISIYCIVHIFKGRPLGGLKLGISLVIIASSVMILVINGVDSIYWSYPSIIILFILLPPGTALKLIAVFSASIFFVLFPSVTTIQIGSIMASIALSSLSNYFIFKSYRNIENDLERRASEDYLTGVGNRSAFDKELNRSIGFHSRGGPSASLMLFDLDDFKSINDKYGHTMGDKILVQTVECVRSTIRSSDSIFRYGGEEFTVLIYEDSLDKVLLVAEKIRKKISAHPFPIDLPVSVSAGVSLYQANDTSDSWIERADKALYHAKANGKNRVTAYSKDS